MKDRDKTKEQPMNELVELRQRIAELEATAADRKRTEEALRETNARLNTLLETIPDVIYFKDAQGRNLVVNESFEQLAGMEEEEIIGKTDEQILPPYLAEQCRRSDEEAIERGKPIRVEEQITDDKGERILFETIKSPVFDEQGHVRGLVGVSRDITERKRAEEEIRWRAETLAALQETALDLAAQRALPDLLRAIAARAVNLLRAKRGSVYLYRPATDDLLLAIDYNVEPEDVGTVLKRGEGLSGKVLETGQPMAVADYSRWEGRSPQFEEVNFAPVVGVPIFWGDHLLGVLNVLDDAPRAFSPADIALLERFTPLAAAALEQARLLEEERTRRREAETLRQAATVLNSTLDLGQVLDLILDHLAQVVPYDSASVMLVSPEQEVLQLVVSRGLPDVEQAMQVTIPLADDVLFQEMLRTRQPVILPDAQQDERFLAAGGTDYVRGWIGAPLVVKGRVIGDLTVDSRQPGVYGQEETEVVAAFAAQAAIAIENARLYQEAERLAVTDGLTGLYNRRHFYELLEREVASAKRYDDHQVSLIIVDTDNLKVYNDTYGHLAGDALLRELAQLLTQNTRKMDVVARYGGDEFVILLPHTDKEHAIALAERIRADVQECEFCVEEGLPVGKVTVSLGVAACPEDALGAEDLVRAADMALFEAKKPGGNRVCA